MKTRATKRQTTDCANLIIVPTTDSRPAARSSSAPERLQPCHRIAGQVTPTEPINPIRTNHERTYHMPRPHIGTCILERACTMDLDSSF